MSALTREEWARGGTTDGTIYTTAGHEIVARDYALGDRALIRHQAAMAAMCLHNQPFGFTWADVEDLRQAARDRRLRHLSHGHRHGEAIANALESLADRIEALLPPREP